jgi:hypothetical protein
MNGKILTRLFLSAIISAAAAVGLQTAGLSPFIIILGFRFHVCLVIPGLFFITDSVEAAFRAARYSWGRQVGLFILFLAIAGIPFAFIPSGMATFQKNDNFYELGVSSVIDLPLYFIWNLPQLIMLYFVLKITTRLKASFVYVLFFMIVITVPAFIPPETPLPIWNIAGVCIVILIAAMLVYKSANWLEFSLLLFLAVWSTILIFGTQSEMLVKLLLGKNYDSWDGFIEVRGFSNEIVRTGYLFIILLATAMIKTPNKVLEKLKKG